MQKIVINTFKKKNSLILKWENKVKTDKKIYIDLNKKCIFLLFFFLVNLFLSR
jgi:hypothetical protein